ncbi:MAG: hypothetical protein EAZ89_18130 [Bacteroidetes bacterium]|nr:MAG: hypothetical protein EAZ89_18130 [Bacteroidota bacterium]
MIRTFLRLSLALLWGLPVQGLFAQKPVTHTYVLQHVTVVTAPGKTIPNTTVLIKNGLIAGIGPNLRIPGEAQRIEADSMYVYAGFIEGLSHTGIPRPKAEERGGNAPRIENPGEPTYEQAGITPNVQVRSLIDPSEASIANLRGLGFTAAHVVPRSGMMPGSGAVVLLGGKTSDEMILRDQVSFFSQFTPARRMYPATVLGLMAKWREMYLQSGQAQAHMQLWQKNPAGVQRPAYDRMLEAFFPVLDKKTAVYFKAQTSIEAYRALTLQKELGFPLVLSELREGWDMAPDLKASGASVLLSLNLPAQEKKDEGKKAAADSLKSSEKAALEKKAADVRAKYIGQAAGFQQAGIPFAFSTLELRDKDFRSNLLAMIEAGLHPDTALAALTTRPARLLGLSTVMGTAEKGKMANLVISDKPYFDKEAKVRFVFVDGEVFRMETQAKAPAAAEGDKKGAKVAGKWDLTIESPQGATSSTLNLSGEPGSYKGNILLEIAPQPIDIENIVVSENQLNFSFSLNIDGETVEIQARLTVNGESIEGVMATDAFGELPAKGTRIGNPD